jgi:energy-converting hydrogenase Eha subunit C
MNSRGTIEYPTVGELRRLVKKRERARFSAMWFLEPIQAYFSYALIRLGLNSIQVTVLWFMVALAGYAVNCIGTPMAFIGGAVLLYLKTILDGCDGEVARFHKQFVSEEEDLTTFINGIYLDKVFHIIEKPLWGISLAFGLYVCFGEPWIFAGGLSVALFHVFCRHNSAMLADIPRRFAARVKAVAVHGQFADLDVDSAETAQDSVPIRIMDKVNFWMRNGKRLNSLIIGCSVVDLGLSTAGYETVCLLVLFITVSVFAPLQVAFMIVRTLQNRVLVRSAMTQNL